MSQQTVPDLSPEGVDGILAALHDAGVETYYTETDGETALDIWLDPVGAAEARVLSWRTSDADRWCLTWWADGATAADPTDRWYLPVGGVAWRVAEISDHIRDSGADPIAEVEAELRRTIAEGGDCTDLYARLDALRAVAPAEPVDPERAALIVPGSSVATALAALALFHPATRTEAFALLRMYARRHELTAADRAEVLAHYRPTPADAGVLEPDTRGGAR